MLAEASLADRVHDVLVLACPRTGATDSRRAGYRGRPCLGHGSATASPSAPTEVRHLPVLTCAHRCPIMAKALPHFMGADSVTSEFEPFCGILAVGFEPTRPWAESPDSKSGAFLPVSPREAYNVAIRGGSRASVHSGRPRPPCRCKVPEPAKRGPKEETR